MEEHDLTSWAAPPAPPNWLDRFRHWQSLSDGFLVALIIVAPTFLFEELWRGRPMISQPGAAWLIPAVLLGLGFFFGGRVAGRYRSTAGAAFLQGLMVAALVLVMIFLADMIRRLVLTQGLDGETMAIWAACSFGALMAAGLGGINGRRGARKAKRRYQMERFH